MYLKLINYSFIYIVLSSFRVELIVGWVGEFGQLLSLLQISTKSDYLAVGCSDACKNDYENKTCTCTHTSFVRYSNKLLQSMHKGLLEGERGEVPNSYALMHTIKHGMRYDDLLSIVGQANIFHSHIWKGQNSEIKSKAPSKAKAKANHHTTNSSSSQSSPPYNIGILLEVFQNYEDEYRELEHRHISNLRNFTQPAKPIGLIFLDILPS